MDLSRGRIGPVAAAYTLTVPPTSVFAGAGGDETGGDEIDGVEEGELETAAGFAFPLEHAVAIKPSVRKSAAARNRRSRWGSLTGESIPGTPVIRRCSSRENDLHVGLPARRCLPRGAARDDRSRLADQKR